MHYYSYLLLIVFVTIFKLSVKKCVNYDCLQSGLILYSPLLSLVFIYYVARVVELLSVILVISFVLHNILIKLWNAIKVEPLAYIRKSCCVINLMIKMNEDFIPIFVT